MSAKTVLADLDSAYRSGVAQVPDPGSAGTFQVENKGIAVAVCSTAGPENRALPDAAGFGVGTELTVVLDVDGGDMTVTGSAANAVFTAPGDVAQFVVSQATGVKVWRTVGSSLT